MHVLVVGQFFPPINGCSLANEVLVKQMKINSIHFNKINTSVEGFNDKALGKFSLRKVTPIIKQYANIFKIRNTKLVYTTPGQTFFGILKYAPFYSACLIFKVPYIIHVHGNYLGKQYQELKGFKKWLFGFFIKRATKGIVLSESLRPIFDGLLESSKIEVVENFAESWLTNSLLVKNSSKLKVLFLSNLVEAKGIIHLIESFKVLTEKGVELELHLAGKVDDGLRDYFDEILEDKSDNIFYHGVVEGEEKKKLLEECNVFCLPTYYEQEGQPISILEGMLTKNIIVTTNHAGIPAIFSEKNGFFCEKKSSESLVNIFLDINNNLKSYIEKFSHYNFLHVSNNFTEEKFGSKLISIFNEVSRTK
jgi:glycosyltransferase involved in cell wall biosynthesis